MDVEQFKEDVRQGRVDVDRLVELVLMLAQRLEAAQQRIEELERQLFTFVTAAAVKMPNGETAPVAGTNNEAERTLRAAAEARKTGRTSKTLSGARRRTVIVSVLESLRQHVPTFTLPSVIQEIQSWSATGTSCFAKLLRKLKLTHPSKSILDLVLLTIKVFAGGNDSRK
jgi:hypothetical protein